MINLYEDQEEFVEKVIEQLREGRKSILGVASPAFGKTVVAGFLISQARAKNHSASCWFLVHRKNLLRQTSKSFWAAHIEHGLLTSGRRKSNLAVQVGTIRTVHSRLSGLTPPRVMFIDEAHLARGTMFEKVIQWARNHGTVIIGLTGTPERLDGMPLGDVFDVMVEAKPTSWLIQQGRLSDYKLYTTNVHPDLSGVRKSGNDYNREQLADAMNTRVIVGDVIAHWRRYANNMLTVCYCANVAHSKATADAFNAAGIPAAHVDADTTEAELRTVCEGLASGTIKVMCNCELVIEGFDLSAQLDGADITLECCILLRPTQSLARYLQMVFRALRRKPYPAVILDHAGCAMQHGLPDDEREWSLDGRKRGKRSGVAELAIQQCPSCFCVFQKGPDCCPGCGVELPKKPRAELKEVEGELQEIDVTAARKERKKEQGAARTIKQLVDLGIRRGMKKPAEWAAITDAARRGKKPTQNDFHQARIALQEVLNEQRNADSASDTDSPF